MHKTIKALIKFRIRYIELIVFGKITCIVSTETKLLWGVFTYVILQSLSGIAVSPVMNTTILNLKIRADLNLHEEKTYQKFIGSRLSQGDFQ